MIDKNNLPEGWTIARFDDLLDYIQPTEFIVESTDYDDKYKTPVLTAGKSFIKGYTNETKGIFNSLPAIIFDDFTTATQFVNFPFKVKSSAMKILKPTSKLVNINLAYHFMQTVHIKSDTHKRYWISEYSKLPIPLAPLKEQERIISKLEELFSDLDKGIESLKKAQEQLKVYRQSVLKWAFEGKLTNEKPVEGKLPQGWINSNLGELKEFSLYGPRFSSQDYSDTGVAILRTTDISENGKVDWLNAPKLNLTEAEYQKYKLIKDDLLITRTGSIGTASIFNDDKRAIAGAFLIYYRLKKPINIQFIFYFIKSHTAQKHFKKLSSGVGRPNLNVPNIELLKIPIPPIEKQNEIVKEIESRLSVCDKIEETITESLLQAEALRLSIIKKAYEGKLVKQNPKDEPATKLLERIRAEKKRNEPEEKGKDKKRNKGILTL